MPIELHRPGAARWQFFVDAVDRPGFQLSQLLLDQPAGRVRRLFHRHQQAFPQQPGQGVAWPLEHHHAGTPGSQLAHQVPGQHLFEFVFIAAIPLGPQRLGVALQPGDRQRKLPGCFAHRSTCPRDRLGEPQWPVGGRAGRLGQIFAGQRFEHGAESLFAGVIDRHRQAGVARAAQQLPQRGPPAFTPHNLPPLAPIAGLQNDPQSPDRASSPTLIHRQSGQGQRLTGGLCRPVLAKVGGVPDHTPGSPGDPHLGTATGDRAKVKQCGNPVGEVRLGRLPDQTPIRGRQQQSPIPCQPAPASVGERQVVDSPQTQGGVPPRLKCSLAKPGGLTAQAGERAGFEIGEIGGQPLGGVVAGEGLPGVPTIGGAEQPSQPRLRCRPCRQAQQRCEEPDPSQPGKRVARAGLRAGLGPAGIQPCGFALGGGVSERFG